MQNTPNAPRTAQVNRPRSGPGPVQQELSGHAKAQACIAKWRAEKKKKASPAALLLAAPTTEVPTEKPLQTEPRKEVMVAVEKEALGVLSSGRKVDQEKDQHIYESVAEVKVRDPELGGEEWVVVGDEDVGEWVEV